MIAAYRSGYLTKFRPVIKWSLCNMKRDLFINLKFYSQLRMGQIHSHIFRLATCGISIAHHIFWMLVQFSIIVYWQ